MGDEEWSWELAPTAEDDLAALDAHQQDRLLDTLDEIVSSPWRDPADYGNSS